MPVLAEKYLFSVADYYRMAEAGILGEDDRVELIEGEIVQMTPVGSRHASCVNRLNVLFSQRSDSPFIICVQNPIRLGNLTEPQPDIVLAKPRDDYYESCHPTPDDILLLVEIADSSIEYDRQTKIPLYARHGIPESWLVDLVQRTIEIYTNPTETGYLTQNEMKKGDVFSPLAFPELQVSVEEIIG